MLGYIELFVKEVLRENPQSIEMRASTDREQPSFMHTELYRVWLVDGTDPVWILVNQTDESLATVPAKKELIEEFFPDFVDDFMAKHHRINDSAAETIPT